MAAFSRATAPQALAELVELDELIAAAGGRFVARELTRAVTPDGRDYPVTCISTGPPDPTVPALGLFGGVHGLERIGSQVILSFLADLVADASLVDNVRLVCVPVVNPGGMVLGRRSNPGGVDLMRNSPTQAVHRPPPLGGGHRLGPWLPWYRGRADAGLEPEAQAIVDLVADELAQAPALLLDVHSGFGSIDRLWYPFARQRGGFPLEAQARGLGRRLDSSHPDHPYSVEPQANSYTAHGDLWDHVFDLHTRRGAPPLLPWTLEMGSWAWLRRRPWRVLQPKAWFDPMSDRRRARVRARHRSLLRFFLNEAATPESWTVG